MPPALSLLHNEAEIAIGEMSGQETEFRRESVKDHTYPLAQASDPPVPMRGPRSSQPPPLAPLQPSDLLCLCAALRSEVMVNVKCSKLALSLEFQL